MPGGSTPWNSHAAACSAPAPMNTWR
jgi:hypothetical protein